MRSKRFKVFTPRKLREGYLANCIRFLPHENRAEFFEWLDGQRKMCKAKKIFLMWVKIIKVFTPRKSREGDCVVILEYF